MCSTHRDVEDPQRIDSLPLLSGSQSPRLRRMLDGPPPRVRQHRVPPTVGNPRYYHSLRSTSETQDLDCNFWRIPLLDQGIFRFALVVNGTRVQFVILRDWFGAQGHCRGPCGCQQCHSPACPAKSSSAALVLISFIPTIRSSPSRHSEPCNTRDQAPQSSSSLELRWLGVSRTGRIQPGRRTVGGCSVGQISSPDSFISVIWRHGLDDIPGARMAGRQKPSSVHAFILQIPSNDLRLKLCPD